MIYCGRGIMPRPQIMSIKNFKKVLERLAFKWYNINTEFLENREEKMKKHFFGKLLCLLMAGAMAFGLAACDPDNGDGEPAGGDGPYTVTFHMEGHGGTEPQQQTVDKGGYATRPTPEPTDNDYDFGGWYEQGASTEFNFTATAIEKNTDLYAQWTPKQSGGADTSTPLASTASIYLVGDSTVCDYERTGKLDNAYLPRYGYGTQLINYLNAQPSQIKNLALSGRSSLDYKDRTEYATLTNNIKSGDYLIIGFGHNDEKADTTLHTDPKGDYQTATSNGSPSFQYNLYENYVKVAKDVGATPILCTPIVRYADNGKYENDKIHNPPAYGDYAAAIRQLASDTNTALVDLTTITKEIYEADNTAAQYFHCHTSYAGEKPNETPTGKDNTHLNKFGAKVVAYHLLKNLPNGCSLKDNVITNSVAPTYANDYEDAKHPTYVRPDYSVPTLSGAIAHTETVTPVDWYKTAYGDIGGSDSKANDFTISYDNGTGTFTVGNPGKTNGKISGTSDGFAAAFIQIDANKNFTASATVNLSTVPAETNNQMAFGMMLRDDMRINKYMSPLDSNFIAVGALQTLAVFKRDEKKLTSESNLTTTLATNKTYQLTITRLDQKVTLNFSDGTNTYEHDYTDVKMVSVDSEYMYLCLFATRGLEAKFTNVQFEITGDARVEA